MLENSKRGNGKHTVSTVYKQMYVEKNRENKKTMDTKIDVTMDIIQQTCRFCPNIYFEAILFFSRLIVSTKVLLSGDRFNNLK